MMRWFSDLQTARLNEIYYQRRAAAVRRLSWRCNVAASIAASSAVAGGLAAFPIPGIKWILAGLALVAALLAAVVPVMGLEDEASRLEKAAMGWSLVFSRLRRLLGDLKGSELSPEHLGREAELDALRLFVYALDQQPSDTPLVKTSWDQVLRELPSEQAWTLV